MDANFRTNDGEGDLMAKPIQPKRMKVSNNDEELVRNEVSVSRITTKTSNVRTRLLPPLFSSGDNRPAKKSLSPLERVSELKTEEIIDDVVGFSVERAASEIGQPSSRSSSTEWIITPAPKQEESVVHWPFGIAAKPSLHEPIGYQERCWSSMFPSSHQPTPRSMLENPSSESNARWPFSIACTPPVYQALDFPVTPTVYSFPLFTALDSDLMMLNETSGKVNNNMIVPSQKQDIVETVQSIAPDPKVGE